MSPTQMPRRDVDPHRVLPPAKPARFVSSTGLMPPEKVQSDMGDLASRVRDLMALQQGQPTRLSLGGALFDVVVTANGIDAYTAVARMDEIQREGGGPVNACGPVIEDPEQSCLFWLVPPGTSTSWEPHLYGVCLGQPHEITLPAATQTEPPGMYWLRTCRGDRLVPPGPLRELLAEHRPGPVPHHALQELLSGASF